MSSLVNYCSILSLHETLLTNVNSNTLENINTNFNAIQLLSVRKSNKLYGWSIGELTILWNKNTNIKYFPVHGNNSFIELKLFFG